MSNKNTNAKQLQVLQTTDYSKFRVMEGNRNVNTLHLARLKISMEEDYLISPIIVNEGLEVIDGQHRLRCVEELGLPVYYIICEGYGVSEVHRYNGNSKNWTMDDFMSGYIEMGKKEYEFYKGFKERYGFGHTECLMMLTGYGGGEANKIFQSGKLRIKKYNDACIIADKIKKIEPYYDGFKRRGFVGAIIYLLKNPSFDIEEFIDKLKFQQYKMYDCSRIEQYVELIEEIYNFKRRNHEKISLRYAGQPNH